jgi:hypothetical protein
MRYEGPAYRGPFVRHSSSDGDLRKFAIWIVPSYSDQRMSTVTGAAPTAGRLLIRKRLPFAATAYWKRATRARDDFRLKENVRTSWNQLAILEIYRNRHKLLLIADVEQFFAICPPPRLATALSRNLNSPA